MKPASRQDLIDFCLRNKYFNWYCSIVDRAKTRNWSKRKTKEYFERHHIIPKSICPEKAKDKTNIVTLTAREHFICHMLLTKCMISAENTTKMHFAIFKLLHGNNKSYTNNSRSYDRIQKNHSIAASQRNKNWWNKFTKEERSAMRSGSNNGTYGLPCSDYRKQRISEANVGNKYRLGMFHSEESKSKMSINRSGISPGKWYFDSITNKAYLLKEAPFGNNWNSGRKGLKKL